MRDHSLREKFKNNIFVKPLYRKVEVDSRVKPKKRYISFDIDNNFNLGGDDFSADKKVVCDKTDDNKVTFKIKEELPGECGKSSTNNIRNIDFNSHANAINVDRRCFGNVNMLNKEERKLAEVGAKLPENDKTVQADSNLFMPHRIPGTWLRIYPLPKLADETVCSIIFRCIMCQLGLSSVLILWTVVWVFVIHSFEGPYEMKVSSDFEREQNQLVIDLATELRQITPLSSKWKNVIMMRIEEERQLTMMATSRGAKLHPGQFWDLSDTFLFTVYVMTALGFGAPVPQTLWGRTSALVYAVFAVPIHIFLMVNASTCIIAHVETCIVGWENRLRNKRQNSRTTQNESPNSHRNSYLIKSSNSRIFKNTMRFLSMFCACRCVPLAMVVYYTCGAVAFGVLRDKQPLEVVMFPLEFTTTGGLERVKDYVRILYGFYVEGAMMLLACALAALRWHSSSALNCMTDKYRLYQVHIEQ